MSKQKLKIFLVGQVKPRKASDTFKKVLGNDFEVVERAVKGEEQLAEEMEKEYDAIVVNPYISVTSKMIQSMSPKIKAIVTLSVGFDHIDVAAAEERGIEVLNAAIDDITASTYAVAEHAFAILLDIVRKVSWQSSAIKEGDLSWLEASGGQLWGRELFGSSLGVIGVGRIGSHISRIARGFQMDVIGYDPYVSEEKVLENGVNLVENLKEILSRSDFLILASCLTEETKEIIGQNEVNSMKEGVYISNIARGALVNEKAILQGLRNGIIEGYATDVLAVEPPTTEDSPILDTFKRDELPNLLVTPHIAWVSEKSPGRYGTIVANRIKETLAGEHYPHVVDYLKRKPTGI